MTSTRGDGQGASRQGKCASRQCRTNSARSRGGALASLLHCAVGMNNINLDQLSLVSGGQTPTGAVLDALNKRFDQDGVVSLMGKPHFGPASNGVEKVSGKFDVNALWGGDGQRSFTGNYNVGAKTVSGLRTKQLSAE
jgi:hypothetical protein